MGSPEFGGYHPKTVKELREQFRVVDDRVSPEPENKASFIPPSKKEKDILKMSQGELKNTWPYRYEMYLRLVKELQKFREGGGRWFGGRNAARRGGK